VWRAHPLQHLVGSVSSRSSRSRRRCPQQPHTVPRGRICRHPPHRAHFDHSSVTGLAIAVLPRQGSGRTDPRRQRVSYAIARPAILFGGDGVLINNIAWLLRHLPAFAIGGTGRYRVRGIHVDDLARLCVLLGAGDDTVVIDAVGPQSLTFREMVNTVRTGIGSHALVLSVPGPLLIAASRALSLVLRDTLLTSEEYHAMADGLADSDAPASVQIQFTDWITEHTNELGRRYANELDRHFRGTVAAGQ
jgi:hypothetical protein